MRNLLVSILLLASCSSGTNSERNSNEKNQNLLSYAKRELIIGNFQNSLDVFQPYVDSVFHVSPEKFRNPDSLLCEVLIGEMQAMYKLKMYPELESIITLIDTTIVPDNPPAHYLRLKGKSQLQKARLFKNAGETNRAMPELEASLKCFQQCSDSASISEVMREMAYLHFKFADQRDMGMKLIVDALPFALTDSVSAITNGFQAGSRLYTLYGQSDKSLEYLEKVQPYFPKSGIIDPDLGLQYFNLLGLCQREMGKFHKSLLSFQSAQQFISHCKNKDNIADLYNNMALTFESVGQPVKGISYLEKAIEIRPHPTYYSMLSLCHGKAGNRTKEIEYAKTASSIAKVDPKTDTISLAYYIFNVGAACKSASDWDSAVVYFHEAERLFLSQQSDTSSTKDLIGTYSVLSTAYSKLNNASKRDLYYSKIKSLLDPAIKLIQEDKPYKIKDPEWIAPAIGDMAAIQFELAQEGRISYQNALQTYEKQEILLKYLANQTDFIYTTSILHSLLTAALGKLEIAYEYKDSTGVTDSLVVQLFENIYNSKLNLHDRTIDEASEINTPLKELLSQKYKERNSLMIQIDDKSLYNSPEWRKVNQQIDSIISLIPAYSASLSSPGLLKELQKNIEEDEMFLMYHLSDKYIYQASVSVHGVYWFRQEKSGELLKAISQLRYSISTNQPVTSTHSKMLYNRLIQPFSAYTTGIEKIIIIADNELTSIPFEILEPESSGQTTYLSDQIHIAYEYSLGHWLRSSKLSKPNPDVLAFAPLFGEGSNGMRAGLLPLPASKEEVDFAVEMMGGKKCIGSSAVESSFEEFYPNYQILHFATHGFLCEERPELSGLVLHRKNLVEPIPGFDAEPVNIGNNNDDNILYAYEIQGTPLNTDLVILSACNTNVGALDKSDGVQSLTRAFRYAGSKAVLSTLWPVDDKSTSEIIQSFYHQLTIRNDAVVALSEAKRSYRKLHPEKSPYYWAGLVITGDPEFSLAKEDNESSWLWKLLLILTVIITAFIFIRRGKHT